MIPLEDDDDEDDEDEDDKMIKLSSDKNYLLIKIIKG